MSVTLKPLKRLIDLFAKSVNNEELPKSIRVFASQCMILTAHVTRIESKFDSKLDEYAKATDTHIQELTDLVHILAQRQGMPTAAAPAAGEATTPPPIPTTPSAAAPMTMPDNVDEEEEDEANDLLRRTLAEAEADVAKANGATDQGGVA